MDKKKKSLLAENLISLRKKQNMTQSEIAETLGIKRSTYAYYERTTMPPMGILRQLAKLFNTTVDEIIGKKTTYTINPDNNDVMLVFRQDPPAYNAGEPSEKLSGDEKILLARYQSLSTEQKLKVQDYIRIFLNGDDE